jgi:hypothetical protein
LSVRKDYRVQYAAKHFFTRSSVLRMMTHRSSLVLTKTRHGHLD